ncbi:hypothetical protein ACJZ2D_015262 [Fusarium nematophilum]
MAGFSNGFQYPSILQGRQIRILFLKPCLRDGRSTPLEVQLEEKCLDTAEFDAMSYVWGDNSRKLRIRCNGKIFDIGHNLHEALIEHRRRGTVRGLWIDALCINQGCVEERTNQVRLMSEIYSKAAHTTIWLGARVSGDELGIDLAQSIYDKRTRGISRPMDEPRRGEDFDCGAWGIPDLANGRETNDPWKALFNLLSHPWFGRVWVIQEVVLSRNPVFWRGDQNISVPILMWTGYEVGTRRNLHSQYAREHDFGNFTGRCMAYFFYQARYAPSLWLNLFNSMGMQATDPRDRFFAIAGISGNLPANFVNYSISAEQIATQVGLMTLASRDPQDPEGLDFLADYPTVQTRAQHIQIPSWVPDFFSDQHIGFPLGKHYSTRSFRKRHPIFPHNEIQLTIGGSDGQVRKLTSPQLAFSYHSVGFPTISYKARQGYSNAKEEQVKEIQLRTNVFDKIKALMPAIDLIKNEKSNGTRPASGSAEGLRETFQDAYQLSARVIWFINRARLLAEPEVRNHSVISGSTFDAFWRTLLYNRSQYSSEEEMKPESSVGVSFGYWYLMLKLICATYSEQDGGSHLLNALALHSLARPFMRNFNQIHSVRRFFVSEGGKIGWAPSHARVGDSLTVFEGCRIPFAIRVVENEVWRFVGGCYVHECMDGEIWKAAWSDWDYLRFK